MKSVMGVALLMFSSFAMGEAPAERDARELSGPESTIQHFVEEVQTPESVYEQLSCMESKGGTVSSAEGIDWNDIINKGEKIWKIIQDNKAVLNATSLYANALPKGVEASELEGFSDPQFKSYRMYGKNGFGFTVYDVTYTVVHRYNGSYEGKGKYLENVTVLPHKVSALWGYTLNLAVTNVSTVNCGSKADPVGSILLELYFRVSTIMKVSEYRNVFEFRGDLPTVKTIKTQF
jgi:hypothetical protein